MASLWVEGTCVKLEDSHAGWPQLSQVYGCPFSCNSQPWLYLHPSSPGKGLNTNGERQSMAEPHAKTSYCMRWPVAVFPLNKKPTKPNKKTLNALSPPLITQFNFTLASTHMRPEFLLNFEGFAVLKSFPVCCAMFCTSLCLLLLSTLLSCVSYSYSSWDRLRLMLLALGPGSCQVSSFMWCFYSWGLPSAFIDEFLDSHTEELVNDPFFCGSFHPGIWCFTESECLNTSSYPSNK